jgi:hypothetical protein
VVRAQPTVTSWELLVQWHDRTTAKASWEEMAQFKEAYLDFELKDKLFRQGGGSVMDSFFHRQYTRRSKTNKGKGFISG